MNTIEQIILAFFASFAIALIIGLLGTKTTRFIGLIDWPGSAPHKQHGQPTPLAGGIVLALSLVIVGVIFRNRISHQLVGVFLAATVILGFGLWDDAKGLPPYAKLIGQVLASIIAIGTGIHVDIFGNPTFIYFHIHYLNAAANYAVTIFWLVGVTNAFNLVDSMDGIVAGLSSLTCVFLILATLVSQQPWLVTWSAILFGICVSMYIYNSPPAYFFLGDSGAQTLGFLLSATALLYSPLHANQASSWFVPIMLMGVPIFDTCLVVYSRLRRKLPVYQGNLDHTYHRLVKLGISPNRAVLLMHLFALSIDCLALIAFSFVPLFANLIFFACLLMGLSLVLYLDRRKIWA